MLLKKDILIFQFDFEFTSYIGDLALIVESDSVTRSFVPDFFIRQLLMVPIDKPRNEF
jgi:hypothetical protein